METKIKFTVIVSVNTSTKHLKVCLTSLIDQYYPYEEYEVILAYPSNSLTLIDDIKYVYTPFELKKTVSSKNSTEAKNNAISMAQGEIILFIDGDVVCATDLLAMHEKAHRNVHQDVDKKRTIILGSFNFAEELMHKPLINYLQNNKNSLYNVKFEAYKEHNYKYFYTNNLSIKRAAFSNNLFEGGDSNDDFANLDLSYRLEKQGYSIFTYPDAVTINMNAYDINELLNNREKKGIDIIKFLHKHNTMLKKSRELTGFDFQAQNILTQIEKSFFPKENFKDIISTLEKISKIKIDNTSFIPTGQGKHINTDKLTEILDKYVNLLSTHFFRKGLLEGIKKYGLPKLETWEINEKTRLKKNSRKKLRMLICSDEIQNDLTINKIISDELISLNEKNIEIAIFSLTNAQTDTNIPYFLNETTQGNIKQYKVYNHNKPYTLEKEPEKEIEDTKITTIFENILDVFKPDIVRYDTFRPFSFAIAKITHSRNIPSIYYPQDFHLIDPKLMLMRTTTESWVNFDIFANTPLRDIFPQKEHLYIERRKVSLDIINKYTDITLCNSENMKNIFVNYGGTEKKIKVQNIVINKHNKKHKKDVSVTQKKKKLLFSYIGDIYAHNGIHKIIHTASYLEKGSCQINIYGDGYDKYINKMKQVSKSGICEFKGKFTIDELDVLFANTDMLLFPNISHSTDITIALYAISAGIPIITSDMGGIKDYILEAENGLIYNSDSTRQLAKLMTGVILNPVILKELSKKMKFPISYKQYITQQYKFYRETAIQFTT